MKDFLYRWKGKLLPERKFRAARHWSNKELHKVAPLFRGDVINVSGWKDEDKEGSVYREYFSSASSYSLSNYGGERGRQDKEIYLDLEKDLPTELVGKYDVVFNHTTLEHIYDVKKAFKNLCDLSRDVVIVVVPFLQEMHLIEGSFKDYWRFTPYALEAMFAENEMRTIYMAGDNASNRSIYILAIGAKKYPDLPFDANIFQELGNKIIR